MAAGKTKHKALWLILGSFIGLIILVIAIIGGKYYMEKQRATQLYQHGFKLYEEQIATYIKEHYSGVRKIEFSPILFRRGGMSNAHIVPVIYDEEGNKAYLGQIVNKRQYLDYGLGYNIWLDFDGATGKQIIELVGPEEEKIEVQDYNKLPEKAKLKSARSIDDNITAFVNNKNLKDIKKSKAGSPNAKIKYNVEIEEGEYLKWR